MSDHSKIEWTDATWNPPRGCTKISPGCKHCYAETFAELSSLLLGIAAGMFGLDKAFGISSGWTRYVLTATLLEKTLEEFRLQWTLLMAKAGAHPTPDQVEGLLSCARDFRVAVAAAVLQETKDWVTEFQNNLAQLEQDTRAQLATLRAKVEQTAQAKAAEAKSGAIELTVTDADAAEGFSFDVTVEGEKGPVVKETVRNMKTWVGLAIAPGQYRLLLNARISGKDVAAAKVVVVSPGEKTDISAQLQ